MTPLDEYSTTTCPFVTGKILKFELFGATVPSRIRPPADCAHQVPAHVA
jgi:hypothetical protein